MTHSIRLLAGIALAGTLTCGVAEAGPVEALEAMREYNLIVFDNFRLNQDIQGSVYVDGNLSNGNMVGSSYTRYSGGAGLTVTGDVTGNNIKVKNSDLRVGGNVSGSVEIHDSGSAYIGGQKPGTVRLTGNTSGRSVQAVAVNPVDVLNRADFFGLSTDLASRAAETSYSRADIRDRNNFRINVADQNKDGIAVVNLSSDFFGGVASYGFSYADAITSLDTVIVNVAGTNINIDANWQTGSGGSNLFASQHIIWNFFEAETVRLGRQIFGSVLAPGAIVSNFTPIDGSVVAGGFTQNGQVHMPGYAGTRLSFAPPPSEIPEPAMIGLLGLGVLGIAGLRRRPATRPAA